MEQPKQSIEGDRMCEPSEARRQTERHHRRARALGGSNNIDNIALVDGTMHKAYHLIFGYGDPSNIVTLLNNQWGPPDVMFYWVPRTPAGLRRVCREINRISKSSQYEIFIRRKKSRKAKLPKDRRNGPHIKATQKEML